jgi:hypothetical protein
VFNKTYKYMKIKPYVLYLHNHSPVPSKMVFTGHPEERNMHSAPKSSELTHVNKALLPIGALNIINSK